MAAPAAAGLCPQMRPRASVVNMRVTVALLPHAQTDPLSLLQIRLLLLP